MPVKDLNMKECLSKFLMFHQEKKLVNSQVLERVLMTLCLLRNPRDTQWHLKMVSIMVFSMLISSLRKWKSKTLFGLQSLYQSESQDNCLAGISMYYPSNIIKKKYNNSKTEYFESSIRFNKIYSLLSIVSYK